MSPSQAMIVPLSALDTVPPTVYGRFVISMAFSNFLASMLYSAPDCPLYWSIKSCDMLYLYVCMLLRELWDSARTASACLL